MRGGIIARGLPLTLTGGAASLGNEGLRRKVDWNLLTEVIISADESESTDYVRYQCLLSTRNSN
jgi:hypothetical protein